MKILDFWMNLPKMLCGGVVGTSGSLDSCGWNPDPDILTRITKSHRGGDMHQWVAVGRRQQSLQHVVVFDE
jgi:hypothetical protein